MTRTRSLSLGALGFLAFLALWEALPAFHIVPASVLPPPSALPKAFWRELSSGIWFASLLTSLRNYLSGLVIGSCLGIALGVATGMSATLESFLSWVVRILRPIPGLAWVPFAILWFGIDPAAAIDLLRGTAKYDLALTNSFDFDYVYPAYIRGLASLELSDGRSAAAQFQKLIDNPGLTIRHVTGPLAWLQLGPAQKMMGDEAAARKSYETFLDLWKNADPDIPIYQQGKAEYANLQQ